MQFNPSPQPAGVREAVPTGIGNSTPGPRLEVPVKQSSAQTFSGNEVKAKPGIAGGSALLEDGIYSAEFTEAFGAAKTALDSGKSRSYAQHFGWVSPEAEEAIHQLQDLIQQKRVASRTGGFGQEGSPVSPLTPHEHQAWGSLLNSLPPVYERYVKASLHAADESALSRSQGTFSPEFTKAYEAARLALESQECKFYEDQLGWLSPGAEEAVQQLRGVMNNKYDASRSAKASQQSFSMKPLTPDEHQAYTALIHSLPPVYKTALPKASNWRAVEPDEVFRTLIQDAAMHTLMLEQPEEFSKFSNELTHAINSKRSEMSEGDKDGHHFSLSRVLPDYRAYCLGRHMARRRRKTKDELLSSREFPSKSKRPTLRWGRVPWIRHVQNLPRRTRTGDGIHETGRTTSSQRIPLPASRSYREGNAGPLRTTARSAIRSYVYLGQKNGCRTSPSGTGNLLQRHA